MIYLPPPPLHVSVGSIFTQCVQGYRDRGRRAALMECLSPVIKNSEDYASKMPVNIAFFEGSPLPAGVSGKTLSKLLYKTLPQKQRLDGNTMKQFCTSRNWISAQFVV